MKKAALGQLLRSGNLIHGIQIILTSKCQMKYKWQERALCRLCFYKVSRLCLLILAVDLKTRFCLKCDDQKRCLLAVLKLFLCQGLLLAQLAGKLFMISLSTHPYTTIKTKDIQPQPDVVQSDEYFEENQYACLCSRWL
jgi:hypothetical protein